MPRYVQDGSLDCGLTGYDWILENDAKVDRAGRAGLQQGEPPAGALGAGGAERFADPERRRTCKASGSPPRWSSSRGAGWRSTASTAKVEFSWGATEVKPPRLADAIVEVTETGSRCGRTTCASSASCCRARRGSSPTRPPTPTRGRSRRWTTWS